MNVFDIDNYSDDDVSQILCAIDKICQSDESEEEAFATVPDIDEENVRYAFPNITREPKTIKDSPKSSKEMKEKKTKYPNKCSLEERIEHMESLLASTNEQIYEMMYNIDFRLKRVESLLINK